MGSRLSAREGVQDANWIHLMDEEEVLWTGRPSRFTIAFSVLGGLLIAVLGIVATVWLGPIVEDAAVPGLLQYLPLSGTVIGLFWAGISYLEWLRLLYVITDEEIYVKYGLVSRDVTQIRLGRVQNTTFEQSVLERFLRYGDVRLYTAGDGTEDLTLRSVPHPEALTRLLTEVLSDDAATHSQGI